MFKIKDNKLFLGLFLLTAAAIYFLSYGVKAAAAQNGNQTQQQTQTANQDADTQTEMQAGQQTQTRTQTQTQNAGEETGPMLIQTQTKAQVNAEEYRSAVANSVQAIQQVANRQASTIGVQVRAIAQQQNQSATTTIRAMEKIQSRSKIQTFLFGSDYGNLGALRSEVVQTRNRLQQLNNLMTSVQNEGDKTELQNQIQTMEEEQTKIENFIQAQEGTFSLFGWLAKMFNR